MHQLVAVDFSMSSTAVSVRKDNTITIFSFVPNYDPKLSKFRLHGSLAPHVQVIGYERAEKVDGYSENEAIKLGNAQNLAKAIVMAIRSTGVLKPRVAFEGFSFGSRGSSFIDLIVFNTFAKKQIMDHFFCPIEVISPATIKRHFSGKGNATKSEMFQAFLERPSSFRDHVSSLVGPLAPEKDPPKPIDDVVDSLAILGWMSGEEPKAQEKAPKAKKAPKKSAGQKP
jgi:hypothetical protein